MIEHASEIAGTSYSDYKISNKSGMGKAFRFPRNSVFPRYSPRPRVNAAIIVLSMIIKHYSYHLLVLLQIWDVRCNLSMLN